MPTITPQGRAVIGGSPDEYRLPRTTVTAPTGMNLPPLKETKPDGNPTELIPETKTGQSGITEETDPKAVTLSPQLTALARRQQKLQSEIQTQRDKETAFEAKVADYVPKSAFKAKLRENPAEALSDLGISYEEITEALLSQQAGDDPVKRLASEVEGLKKAQADTVNKQYDATLKQYRAEADSLVSASPKDFHFILKGKHQDAVVQHIVETWQETPEQVLTVEQAAKEVEEVLRENAKAQAELLRELEPPKEEKTDEKRLPPPQRTAASQPRTLTQRVETAPTRSPNQFQHLSMKERIAQSIARAQK